MPDKAVFCGEKVPLEYFDVRESLGRELNSLSYWHSSMIYTIQLSGRYMGVIENMLRQYDVPDDIKYLCVAESNLQNVVSPARAAGFWQFLPGTAKEFGLQITAEIDERYNLEKATKAACEYLKMAYNRFENWTLAAASYNVGMAHIANQLVTQKQKSYYDLQLNQETIRYVYRAVAYKLVMTEPEKFGFCISRKNMFEPLLYREIDVTGPVDWIAFSAKYGTNYKVLKIFNPWIISTKLSTARTYKVKIPMKRTQ
ncbi:MAG: lytic transglycosylase domain-containing protein [Prevotellaceae bacterium]|nr:lytic transglycosylase domain-containing protein [Prevotellaceae bacterium]